MIRNIIANYVRTRDILLLADLSKVLDDDWDEYTAYAAVRAYGEIIRLVPTRLHTTQLWIEAVITTPKIAVPSHVATYEFYRRLVLTNGHMLKSVPVHIRTTEICRAAIKPLGGDKLLLIDLLMYVPAAAQTENLVCDIIEAMQSGTSILLGVAVQTEKICVMAVTKTPKDINYVENQTWAVCEAALASANEGYNAHEVIPHTLSGIRVHTMQVARKALEYGSTMMAYIRDQSEELCVNAMTKWGHPTHILREVRKQTVNMCMVAWRKDQHSFRHINSPTMRHTIARLVIADKLMALQAIKLPILSMVDVCELMLLSGLFERMPGDPFLPLTRPQLWELAALIKHG